MGKKRARHRNAQVCHYCRKRRGVTKDHIIPQSRAKRANARGWILIWVQACPECNWARATTPYPIYAEMMGVNRSRAKRIMLLAIEKYQQCGALAPLIDRQAAANQYNLPLSQLPMPSGPPG